MTRFSWPFIEPDKTSSHFLGGRRFFRVYIPLRERCIYIPFGQCVLAILATKSFESFSSMFNFNGLSVLKLKDS